MTQRQAFCRTISEVTTTPTVMLSEAKMTIIKVGDKVRVRTLAERGQDPVSDRVGKTGIVREFRVVDGSQVGYVITFEDKTSSWYFEKELEVVGG